MTPKPHASPPTRNAWRFQRNSTLWTTSTPSRKSASIRSTTTSTSYISSMLPTKPNFRDYPNCFAKLARTKMPSPLAKNNSENSRKKRSATSPTTFSSRIVPTSNKPTKRVCSKFSNPLKIILKASTALFANTTRTDWKKLRRSKSKSANSKSSTPDSAKKPTNSL